MSDLHPQPPLQESYDVAIVGAGLAGSSLAIQLARRGFSVFLAEKQRFPAHKLCGEFLSTESSALLGRLGVLDAVHAAGARVVRHAVLTGSGGGRLEVPLPGTAVGLSRYCLDAILWARARAVGVDARDGCHVQDVQQGQDGLFTVTIPDGVVRARLVIGAHGKRSRLDGRLERRFLGDRSGLVAFKAHFTGLDLAERIEMHAFPGGYCGLSPVEDGRVNVCWISDAGALRAGGGTPDGMLETVLPCNPALGARLRSLHRVSARFEAVGQVSFRRKGLFDGGLCMIGDAAAMITPLCGDGMAMALDTAEIAAVLAASYLQGALSRPAFERAYARAWKRRFARRLRVGRLLHAAFAHPATAGMMVRAGSAVPGLASWLVRSTRG